MASKGGFAGVARGVANAVVGASRKVALLILDILADLARAMESAHKVEEREAADAAQIDSKQPENERTLIETSSDGWEFDESGSSSMPARRCCRTRWFSNAFGQQAFPQLRRSSLFWMKLGGSNM